MTLRRRAGSVTEITLYDYLVCSPPSPYTLQSKHKTRHNKTTMYRGEFVEIYIQHIDSLHAGILAGILHAKLLHEILADISFIPFHTVNWSSYIQ
jgi:hypothetical protein